MALWLSKFTSRYYITSRKKLITSSYPEFGNIEGVIESKYITNIKLKPGEIRKIKSIRIVLEKK